MPSKKINLRSNPKNGTALTGGYGQTWKNNYTKRAIKTGMSKAMGEIDKNTKICDILKEGRIKIKENLEKDTETYNYFKALSDLSDKIIQIRDRKRPLLGWTDAEKAVIKFVLGELQAEADQWD